MKKVMLLAPEEICDRLRDVLENKYILLPCSDACIAKEILIAKPNILILSLNLPKNSGLTFLKENRNSLPPKVIVLTAFCSIDILSELADLGVSSVIRTPCKLSSLERELKNTPPVIGRGQTLDVRGILQCGNSEHPHL